MSRVSKDTRVELVAELLAVQPRTRAIAEMIDEARAGEYHDFKNKKYVCGKVTASRKLRASGLTSLAERLESGEFDEMPDEEDRQMIDGLIREMVAGRRK